MKNLTQDQLLGANSNRMQSSAPGRVQHIHRTDGYESGYARGSQKGERFVAALRSRRTTGETVVPSELGRIIERSMIRWEAAGGHGMAQLPLAERSAGFETVRGEMHGFSATLMEAL